MALCRISENKTEADIVAARRRGHLYDGHAGEVVALSEHVTEELRLRHGGNFFFVGEQAQAVHFCRVLFSVLVFLHLLTQFTVHYGGSFTVEEPQARIRVGLHGPHQKWVVDIPFGRKFHRRRHTVAPLSGRF